MDFINDPTTKQLAYLKDAIGSTFISAVFPEWYTEEANVFNHSRDVNKSWQELLGGYIKAGKLTKWIASDIIGAHKERDRKKIREILDRLK